jgi:hypothetical protein
MAKTTAPLLSFNASGSLAKSVVYSKWKGVNYARQHVIPSNPRSTAQTTTRQAFTWLHESFKYFPAAVTDAWKTYAKGKPLTGPNAYMQGNLPTMRGATHLTDLLFAKPTGGGPSALSNTTTAGATQLTVTPGIPTLPTGWAIVRAIAIAMPDQDMTNEATARINHSAVNAVSPYACVITGLTTGTLYETGIFFEYTDANGVTQYGGSVNGTGTPT